MRLTQFLRMAKWARNPPGETQVRIVLVVIACCLLLFGYEWLFGWPEWAVLDGTPKGRINR